MKKEIITLKKVTHQKHPKSFHGPSLYTSKLFQPIKKTSNPLPTPSHILKARPLMLIYDRSLWKISKNLIVLI